MKYCISAITLLLLAICLSPMEALAEDHKVITKRIAARASAIINPMKKAALVGESNRGYLVPRGNLDTKQRKAMADENKDRAALYAIAAAHSGQPKSTIERARAKQIAQRSGKGIWLQDVSGNWYQK